MNTTVSPTPMDLQSTKEKSGMAAISARETREIEAANASGDTPVVFIHGLWLLPSSWRTGPISSSEPATRP